MTTYFDELCAAMENLGQLPNTVFMGQAVAYPGTAMYRTLERVPMEKRLELPVAEDMQLGMAIGMSLNGFLPICIYPRINFLLLAMNQLVLHLDKLPRYSDYKPHVIIRTGIASDEPINPGPQHLGDYTGPIQQMLDTVCVRELHSRNEITPAYREAAYKPGGWLIVEQLGEY